MAKFAKLWWLWAVAALGIAAFVFFRPSELPQDLPKNIESVVSEPPADSSRAGTETSTRPSTAAPEVDIADDAREASVQMESKAPELEVSSAGGLDAGSAPMPEGEASQLTPDPVLPYLNLGDASLGEAPVVGNAGANAPLEAIQPLLGDSSPPLSLAQILPPGAAPAPNQIAPTFDLVRVSPDGSAVIAGRAAPGANVQVFSGNVPVAEGTASARGEFVIFLSAPSENTFESQISAMPEGGSIVVSQEDIVILPAAPNASDSTPIVVRRSPDAVQIVQPAAPAIPGNVSLDLVSYTDSGDVQLAGRGQPGNVARIYTDGALAGEAAITQGGNWALEISDIAEGRYVLRVDEITTSGDVHSRTESPFQRQFPEANMPDSFSQGAKIIVQPGNTLWLMAAEAYGSGDAFSQIFAANKDAIRDPDLIYPGQIFSIPRIEE